jgi:CheY-like chemotaxis protein
MRVLVVEDDAERVRWFTRNVDARGHSVDYAFTAAEGIRLLNESGPYGGIFLDHDLAPAHYAAYLDPDVAPGDSLDAETGYAVAKWLAENPAASRDAKIVVHSMNYPGSQRMATALWRGGRDCAVVPFPNLVQLRSAILDM